MSSPRAPTKFEWHTVPHAAYLLVRLGGDWPDAAQLQSARRAMLAEGVWFPGLRVALDFRLLNAASMPSLDDFGRWSQSWDQDAGAPAMVAVITSDAAVASRYVAAAATYRLPARMAGFATEAAAIRWLTADD